MDIDEVFNPQAGLTPAPTCFEATCSSNPSSVDEGVKVIIEAFDGNQHFGPVPWPTRVDDDGNVLYPMVGSRALVAFSNQHEAWVIAWWDGSIPTPRDQPEPDAVEATIAAEPLTDPATIPPDTGNVDV